MGLPTMMGSLRNLRAAGLDPRTMIDIGAYIGEWTKSVSALFRQARFHMIEAQPDKQPSLEAVVASLPDRASVSMTLLGAEPRESVLFHSLESGSSVLEEVTTFRKNQLSLPMSSLDEIVTRERLQGPFFLKLDVQGYELEVLKGASSTLQNVEALLLEVALIEYNRGAPLFDEVIAFLSEAGFVAYDFCGQFRRESDGALYQTDVIFVRRQSELRGRRKFWQSEPD